MTQAKHIPAHLLDPKGSELVQSLVVSTRTVAQLTARGAWRLSLPHSSPDHMLIWITRGQGRATINGVRRGLGANNILWLPAGTQFSIDPGPQVFGQVVRLHGVDPNHVPMNHQHLRVRDVHAQGELTGLIELIHRELQDAMPLVNEALMAKFSLVEIWIRRMMLQVGEIGDRVQLAVPEGSTAARRLSRAFALLAEDGFRTGASMADYAADLDVTPTHLTRVCREVMGITAADLLTGRTLHEARTLLEDTSAPAKNIAAHLGFGSAAYFSRFMLKHTGHSPSALRKAALARPNRF